MSLVEPILTPAEYLSYYSDKNSFGKIFQGIKMPYVYARNIRGFFFDNDYNRLEKDPLSELLQRKVEGFVLKPSLGESGRGVKLFRYDNGHYTAIYMRKSPIICCLATKKCYFFNHINIILLYFLAISYISSCQETGYISALPT